MFSRRATAVVICPGRGSYNQSELGYLRRLHSDRSALIDSFDAYRSAQHQSTIRELDSGADYSVSVHARSDNAGPLIFSCSYCDFVSINRAAFDVVAITANSMGWYTALACAGALAVEHALRIVNTMGAYFHAAPIGGQIICSTLDDDWQPIPGRREMLLDTVRALHGRDGRELYVSIELGGMIVFSGNEPALAALVAAVPSSPGRFPLRLPNHGAYHSPLQASVSARAKATLPADWFGAPAVSVIDGRGHIWRPEPTDAGALWEYTLGTQVLDVYHFTRAVQVAVREFVPDYLIVVGPGDTLGGAVAQALIEERWRGLDSKAAFLQSARTSPYLLSMGREDQRRLVILPDPEIGANSYTQT